MTQTYPISAATPTVAPRPDRAHDILQCDRDALNAIFSPQTVAVIGASEKHNSVGRSLLWNLIRSPFGGTVFPVNPKRRNILGVRAYADIAAVPEPVDLAVIATPAPTVPGIIAQCADAGVKGAIVISAGFKETGEAGIALEREILNEARRGKMRVIGPNCLGVMSPLSGLNATFANTTARPGNVGFISQSGALCTAVLDWSLQDNVGFSAFISIGSMLDVGWGDLIYHLGDDPATQSIVIYMESIGDARAFLSAAREVALTKPIVVLKAGRTEVAAQAAASHTGTLAGSDDVLDAAFRRCGVLRVHRIEDLFNMAEILAKQPRPRGKRLTVLTNAGGPGVLATDSTITSGGQLATLAPETLEKLDTFLPPNWSHSNPIDILGDADSDRYAKALKVAATDPNSDGLLVILTPQAMTDPTQTAKKIAQTIAELQPELEHKPILASWMGGADVAAGEAILNDAQIYTFPYPDSAARAFNLMWQYSKNLRSLYETPTLARDVASSNRERDIADRIIGAVRRRGCTLLSEWESKQVLEAYGIPTVTTHLATTEEEAIAAADAIGYPVVLKLHSETITHKTDVGGVQLNLPDAEAAREAYRTIQAAVPPQDFAGVTVQPMVKLDGYELILGSSIDPQFGPVLLFGTGGQLVEIFKDRALGLPPLNTTLARRMMKRTQIYSALTGVRGRSAVDLAALEQLLVRFSQLVVERPEIREIDINPLLASADGLLALDGRIILHEPEVDPLPRPAIRPYPSQYVSSWTMSDETPAIVRPIRPEDEPLVVKFHETLSEESVYFRYFHLMKLQARISHDRLTRICFIDYDREIALVAETHDPQTDESEILGICRLSRLAGTREAEFGMLVNDRFQGRGVGTQLLRQLLEVARQEQLTLVRAEILSDNRAMQHLCEKLGFQLARSGCEVMARYEL
ncbi:MAG: bifunctional acetate--CoA ligase family protein/GNAT family N-acetyltransferase [Cyanobacteriota bacterium]|nr:bifunctional acetate--CoA ligase family protein/GNAT family N-acetyltransferase [Cyanobacteriota bacterium]